MKQYHKYTTIKRRNFATVNDKCNLKTYCYGFLSSIGEKENHPRLFRQGSAGRSIGKDLGGGVQGSDKRSPAPVGVCSRAGAGEHLPHDLARCRKHRKYSAGGIGGCRRCDGQGRARHVYRRTAQAAKDAHAERMPRPAVLPAKGLSAMRTRRPKFASAWAAVENILLAATAEGLACAFRIPIGNEPEHVKRLVNAPEGYEFTCFLAIGHAAPNAHLSRQKEIRTEERIHQNIW